MPAHRHLRREGLAVGSGPLLDAPVLFGGMFVSDLRHFLDMPDDAPGPARRLGEQLSFIVRAATAGAVDLWWVTAVPCRRRPDHRPCPGHISVLRADDAAAIEWSCAACGDDGTISGWQDSPYDLSRGRRALSGEVIAVSIPEQGAAALRDLTLLDSDCERVVFAARAEKDGIVLAATAEDLEELAGFVAAEANHETNRRRQSRLDAAFSLLTAAMPGAGF